MYQVNFKSYGQYTIVHNSISTTLLQHKNILLHIKYSYRFGGDLGHKLKWAIHFKLGHLGSSQS